MHHHQLTKTLLCIQRRLFQYLILSLIFTACSFTTIYDNLSNESYPQSDVNSATPTLDSTQDLASNGNCYSPTFLPDRGIRTGQQAIVQSPGTRAFSQGQGFVEFYLERPSLDPDAVLITDETVTILDGPFCFASRNGQNRWWQVRVDATEAVGYVDEYSSFVGILNINLNPRTSNNNSVAIHHFAVSIADTFARPARIHETVYLSWEVSGASQVTISRMDTGEVVGSGSHDALAFVVPNIDRNAIDFVLIATGTDNQQLQEIRTLHIDCPVCTLAPTQVSTQATANQQIEISYQWFEGGLMLYRTDTNQIYVLINNGTVQTYTDSWQGESYTIDEIPVGYFAPQFGFGNIWLNQAGMRDALGWATSGETYYGSNILASGTSTIEVQLSDSESVVIAGTSWQYQYKDG